MMSEITHEGFKNLGLSDATLRALEKKGFQEPTEIQRECIPLLLEKDSDVIGQAQTGTGKTAAFALPVLERLDAGDKTTQALILTPTRELAMQVAEEINSLKWSRSITVEPIYGGTSYENQFKKLKKGIQIVVGTPGRIQDHLERGTLDISHLKFAVLDEADEMLDMGFIEDIETILSRTNDDKRMLLFSATMPDEILRLAKTFMKNTEIVRIKKNREEENLTSQYYCFLRESDKIEVLTRIIDSASSFYAIIFCKTKLQCEEIGRKLMERGYEAEALHGDLSQKQREIILQKMRDHKISILVATDVAARGIDISELTHVINFTLPSDGEVYTHRIGRTGRAGHKGCAITFVTSAEKRRFLFIRRTVKGEIEEYRIPSADEILMAKKERIEAEVIKALEKECGDYDGMASSLLEKSDAASLVKALLRLHYGNDLNKSQYHTIKALDEKREKPKTGRRGAESRQSFTRLFFAKGRNDKFTKRYLANTIIEECGVRDEDLQDIQVMESFSFVNVPSSLAGYIIEAFRDKGEGGRPLIVRARPEEGHKKSISSLPLKTKKPSAKTRVRSRKGWQDEVQPYGRDTYDEDFIPRAKKKEHGKYSKKKKK